MLRWQQQQQQQQAAAAAAAASFLLARRCKCGTLAQQLFFGKYLVFFLDDGSQLL
jgi:hypothetical protein